jgi:FkbH-like protein
MGKLSDTILSSDEALAANDLQGAFRVLHKFLSNNELKLSAMPQLSVKLGQIAHHSLAEKDLGLLRLAILSGNHASGFIAQAISTALAREGVIVKIFEGGYNSFQQEIIDHNSELYAFQPDLILIGLTWHDIALPAQLLISQAEQEALITEYVERYEELWRLIDERLDVPVIQHLFDKPPIALFGAAERQLNGSAHSFIDAFNSQLLTSAPSSVFWLDLDALSAHVGRSTWSSARDYFNSKLPFALKHVNEYARWFAAVYRSASAKGKKCLVLDLDNTLWGGVVGDDGVSGICIGTGTPGGEAYLAFCQYIKSLKERGVTLAVNSKNDPEIAREVFNKRGDMPLKIEDFAAFVCNWEDKPGNMRLISQALNLGLDALVFVDDNPAECAFMRRELPEVTTVELPEDASQFIAHLDKLRLFDAQIVSPTDQARAASYQALQRAKLDREGAASLEEFLTSLEMVACVQQFSPQCLDRLAQMQSRTNQFNVTTRRYHADQIDEAANVENAHCLIISLQDRYTDHGIVASLLAVKEGNDLRIDDWLVSCRAFSRTLEQFIFNHVLDIARAVGAKQIVGEFLATDRNMPVKDLYQRLGFEPVGTGGQWWCFGIPEKGGEQQTFVGEKEHLAR